MSDIVPLALSVEAVRHEMMRGILIPRELVNEALVNVASALKAKEIKYFSHRGRVTDQRAVEDYSAQSAARDQIFSLAGLYARERESATQTPSVAMEVDQVTGIVRIIVGGARALPPVPPPSSAPQITSHSEERGVGEQSVQGAVPPSARAAMKVIFDQLDEG